MPSLSYLKNENHSAKSSGSDRCEVQIIARACSDTNGRSLDGCYNILQRRNWAEANVLEP